MLSKSQFEKLRASGNLPSPKGVALQVMELIRKEDVTNQEIAHAIKSDPALSSRVIKVSNTKMAYQTRPIVSIVDAVSVLGFNTVKQLVLGLSILDSSRDGTCHQFSYQDFWAHSLLTAITAQNLVFNSGIGSSEEVFILGLMGQIGSLALATAHPQAYARILKEVATNPGVALNDLEQAEFGFNHNQLTQAMLADWRMPQVFQEVVLHHEEPGKSSFAPDSRNGRLLHILHIADLFARVCLAQESLRRKMVPKLILAASRLGVDMDALAKHGDKSVHEWQEWSRLCGIRSVEFPPFAELLAAVPLVPNMLDVPDKLSVSAGTFYKLRILLVDDDRATLLLIKNLLEKAGHTVITANNGEDGLGKIEKFKPQLIMTDWMMPEMDGIQFCKALRQNAAWRNIYIFIMTAQEGMEKLVEAFEAGANDYITKPLNPKLLMARLRAGQRVVQLQEELEHDRQHLHKFAGELATSNHRLRKSEVSMRAILENSPYMTWLKDAEGHYINVNHAYVTHARMTDAEHTIKKTDFDLWPKEVADKYRADDVEVMNLRQQKRIEESFLVDDKVHWLETFKNPVIDINGNVLGTTGFARDITERKKIEMALKKESDKNAAFLRNASDGIHILDTEGNIIDASDSFCAMLGYRNDEIIGMNVAQWDAKFSDPELKIIVRQQSRQQTPTRFETVHRRKNGTIFDVEVTGYWLELDGEKVMFYSSRDITERKRYERELRKFQTIIESTDDAIISKNLDGVIDSWNRGAEKMFGYTAKEAIGQSIHILIPPNYRQEETDILERISCGESILHYETVRCCKDGSLINISTTITPILDNDGKVTGGVNVSKDITEHKRTEKILLENEVRLKDIFENLSSGVAVFQPSPDGQDFIITALNSAGEHIDNLRREELVGRNVVDAFPGITKFGLLDVFRRVWKSGVSEHFPVSFYQDGQISGWRENYVYKLANGELVSIFNDVTKEKQVEEKLNQLAHFDVLTGLPNRTLFEDRLQQSLAVAKRDKTHLALMFIDLDKFKPVNDEFGHDVGDLLLKEVAKRMQNCVRESDTVSRIGGDEFVILLPAIDEEQDAMLVGEKILSTLNQDFEITGHKISISGSIGVAVYPEHGNNEKMLTKNADIAMYYAKSGGRNNAVIYQPGMENNQ